MDAQVRLGRKTVWGTRSGALALVATLVASQACGDLSRQGRAPSFLVIDNLAGANGADPGEFTNTVISDVVTLVGDTFVPTVFSDPGEVRMRSQLKDAGSSTSPQIPSVTNYITVTRYRVVYKRADGRNTPGVDVPYPFDGGMTFTAVAAGASAGFTLVRAQAKLESPLFAMRGIGGAVFISAIAEVTFYGHDQTGTPVSVTGTISVHCADWGDPE